MMKELLQSKPWGTGLTSPWVHVTLAAPARKACTRKFSHIVVGVEISMTSRTGDVVSSPLNVTLIPWYIVVLQRVLEKYPASSKEAGHVSDPPPFMHE